MDGQKKRRGYFPLILIIVTLIPLLYGCARKEQAQRKPAGNGGGQEIKIAVSLAGMDRDGNQVIKKTMSARQGQGGGQGGQQGEGQQGEGQQGRQGQEGQQAGQSGQAVVPVQAGGGQGGQGRPGGQRVSITWLDAGNDPGRQEKDLDQLINQKVKAVILQPVDPAAGPRLVRKLAQANIKVITLDTLPADSPVDGYIAFDHARAGELQARYLLSVAQGRPAPLKAVILQGDRNDQASREIAASALENLREQQGVQVVLVKDHSRGDPQLAVSTLEQVLASTNNQIDAVLATDGRLAAAAAEMLKNRGLGQRVITVGVGADQKASRALAAGDHDAEVDVMPELIAQYAFDAAVGLATTGHWQYDKQLRNGDFDVPAKVTPVRLITRNETYLLEQRWGRLSGPEAGAGGGQGAGQGAGQKQGSPGGDREGGGKEGKEGKEGGGRKTTLRITTQDGKTVEMQIDGEIKKIEAVGGGGAGQAGGGQSEGGQGGAAR
ncbi:MAG: substrate-binding domain-containing protein [Peptococcaceae bacterium]|nr:substrate-binding domain-containing protein [Peptococcaceae bacterium]